MSADECRYFNQYLKKGMAEEGEKFEDLFAAWRETLEATNEKEGVPAEWDKYLEKVKKRVIDEEDGTTMREIENDGGGAAIEDDAESEDGDDGIENENEEEDEEDDEDSKGDEEDE